MKCGVDLAKKCGSSCLGWASPGYWGSGAPKKATVQISKRASGRSDRQVLQVMLDESREFGRLMREPAAKEAFGAFLEKRKPDFSGM